MQRPGAEPRVKHSALVTVALEQAALCYQRTDQVVITDRSKKMRKVQIRYCPV